MLDFLCIGAQKAGTSWLHHQLESHPSVAFPIGKEPHYWDTVQDGRRKANHDWYRKKFVSQPGKVLGDMTPAYATLLPPYIEQLYGIFPRARLIFILRNPIERAWSAARMYMGWSQLAPDEVDDHWFRTLFRSRAMQDRGDYETTLRRWCAVFPERQMHVALYEDLGANPLGLLAGVALHIGIDPSPLTAKDQASLRTPVRAGPKLDLSPALRQELEQLYRPKIESLSRYLGMDLSRWR